MTSLLTALLLALAGSARADGGAVFDAAGCRACHRVGLRGGGAGPNLTLVGLRRPRPWLEAWLASPRAWKHDTLMPEQGLSAADRAALAYYLSSQQGQAWKDERPWSGRRFERGWLFGLWRSAREETENVRFGREIYLRAGCVACHGRGGAGGYPNNNVPGAKIPALNNVAETFTKKELVEKIRRGVPAPLKADPKGPDPLVGMPAWGSLLDDSELDAVAAYLLAITPADGATKDW